MYDFDIARGEILEVCLCNHLRSFLDVYTEGGSLIIDGEVQTYGRERLDSTQRMVERRCVTH